MTKFCGGIVIILGYKALSFIVLAHTILSAVSNCCMTFFFGLKSVLQRLVTQLLCCRIFFQISHNFSISNAQSKINF